VLEEQTKQNEKPRTGTDKETGQVLAALIIMIMTTVVIIVMYLRN
jgi:hypothetical protein